MKKRVLPLLLTAMLLLSVLPALALADVSTPILSNPASPSSVFPDGRYEIPFYWVQEGEVGDTRTTIPAHNSYKVPIALTFPDASGTGEYLITLTSDGVKAHESALSGYPYWFSGLVPMVTYTRGDFFDPGEVYEGMQMYVNGSKWNRFQLGVLHYIHGEELTGSFTWQVIDSLEEVLESGETQVYCQLPGIAVPDEDQHFSIEEDYWTFYCKGQSVTVTVTPDTGYIWADEPNFTVKGKDGVAQAVTAVPTENENEYSLSFTMPAGDAKLTGDTVHVGAYEIRLDGGELEAFTRNESTGKLEYSITYSEEAFEGINAFVRCYGVDVYIDGEQYYADRRQIPCAGRDCFIFDNAVDLPLKTLGEEDDGSDMVFLNLLASHPGTYTYILDPEKETLTVTCGHTGGGGDHYSYLVSGGIEDMAMVYVLGDVLDAIAHDAGGEYWTPPTEAEVPVSDFSGETVLWATLEPVQQIHYNTYLIGSNGKTYGGTVTEFQAKALTAGTNQYVKVNKNSVPEDVEAIYDFYYGATSHKLEVTRRQVDVVVDALRITGKNESDEPIYEPLTLPEGYALTASPEGAHYSGDEVTVTAPYVPGMRFVHWLFPEGELDAFDCTFCLYEYGEASAVYETMDGVPLSAFTDPAFRDYVSQKIDTDHNDVLSGEEIGAVKVIDLSDAANVESLEGIENFPLLQELYCDPFSFSVSGKLTQADLSHNPELRVVDLGCNPIEWLDVSMLSKLEELNLGFTKVNGLDLDNNKQLKRLTVNDTKLGYLNVSWNPKLEWLDACGLSLSDGIDIGDCPKLMKYYLAGPRDLDLPHLAGKTVYGPGDGEQQYNLAVDEGTKLYFYFSDFVEDDAFASYLRNNAVFDEAGKLTLEDVNGVVSIDLSLKYRDWDGNEKDYTYASKITSLKGIELFPNLEELNCDPFTFSVSGKLTKVDLSSNKKLIYLDLGGQPLTSVDVSKLTDLMELNLGFTKIASLDLSANRKLDALWVDDSPIASLDLKNNPALTHLDAAHTSLMQLDITGCPSLLADYQAGPRSIDLPQLDGLLVYGGTGNEYNLAIDAGLTVIAGGEHEEHVAGEPVQENLVEATCAAEGSYDEVIYCTICGEEMSRTAKTIEKLAHTPGEAVKENEVAATCGAEGSYDQVVYCTVCHEELSRETKIVPKTGEHTPGEAVKENEVAATCIGEGGYDMVVRCTVCGEIISSEHTAVPATGEHTPGEPVKENEVKATGSAQGSYDEVVYCSVCGEEISRETKYTSKTSKGMTLSQEPKDATIRNKQKATFTVKVSGSKLTYQWYYRKNATAAWKKVSGGTKAKLSVTGSTSNGGYQYYCVIKNGKGTLKSDVATLFVNLFPPVIVSEPEDVEVKSGEKASFTVSVEGEGLTYQWSFKKSATAKWADIKKATKATYSLTAKYANNGYQYRCVITNADGKKTTNTVTLTVIPQPPVIETMPEDRTVRIGETADFEVTATGPDLTYQWYYKKSASATKWTAISKATKAKYSVKGKIANDGYQYRCLIKNADGKLYTDPVTLTVDYHLPEITAQPTIPKSVKKNTSVTLTVEAENIYDAALTFQWYSRKSSSAKWTKIKKATEPTYTFKATTKLNGYQYKCDVTNVDGTVSTKTLKLKVK